MQGEAECFGVLVTFLQIPNWLKSYEYATLCPALHTRDGCVSHEVMTSFNLVQGVTSGPRYPLIRLQALRSRPVSATIANAKALQ